MKLARKFRVVELYAGTARSIEPFRAWQRGEIALMVDSSSLARKTYLANFPKAPYLKRSLAAMQPKEIISAAGGRIDVLLGCPPCQGFSESGKRDPLDPRNMHMSRFAQVIEDARPKAVALENVPMAAASPQYQDLVSMLDRTGYRWKAMLGNAIQYGSCQSRQRLILVAFRKDVGAMPKFPKPTHGSGERVFSYSSRSLRSVGRHLTEMLGVTPSTQRLARKDLLDWTDRLGPQPARTVWDCIGDLQDIDPKEAASLHHTAWNHSTSILRRMGRIDEGAKWSGSADHFAHSYGRLHRRGFSRTITGYFPYAGCGRFWHPLENRSLTLREAARIQGFPDSFAFLDQSKASAKLVGNALDFPFASMCYAMIRTVLE